MRGTTDTTIDPLSNTTREQAIALLRRTFVSYYVPSSGDDDPTNPDPIDPTDPDPDPDPGKGFKPIIGIEVIDMKPGVEIIINDPKPKPKPIEAFEDIEFKPKPGTELVADIVGSKTLKNIGRGYNVFGRYASGLSLLNVVLDAEKLDKAGQIEYFPINSAEFREIEGTSLEVYAKDMTTSASVKGGYLGFKASAEINFSSSYRSQSTSYYNTIQYLIMKDHLFIKASCNYRNYLLPEVKTLLDTGKLNGESKTPEWIFENYGGYVLVNGIFGGRLEYHVTANSEYCGSYSNFKANVKAGYNAGVGSISGEYNHEKAEQREKFLSNSATTVITYGGTGQDGTVLSVSQQGVSKLQEWRDSVPGAPAFAAFGETNALLPIWELCSTEARANELKAAFEVYAKSQGNTLVLPKKGITVWVNENYVGDSKVFDVGNYSNMGDFGINDQISSLRVEPGRQVRAYQHDNYGGRFWIFEGGKQYTLGGSWWDNTISSMIVEDANENNVVAARIYWDEDYGGSYQVLPVGDYPNMSKFLVTNDKASSIKVTPGYKVIVYWDVDYKGGSREFTSDVSNLGSWNDKISSIKVMKK